MRLEFGEGLLRETLAVLRRCGAGSRECVCWLTGPIARPGVVDTVLHPVHTASAGAYEIDDAYLTQTWLRLARAAQEVRMQVHTHPGAAYHSAIDDAFPLVRTPGFLSLVIPRFARDVDDLNDAYLAELDADGTWTVVAPAERLVVA